jgi:hypothetical protein
MNISGRRRSGRERSQAMKLIRHLKEVQQEMRGRNSVMEG